MLWRNLVFVIFFFSLLFLVVLVYEEDVSGIELGVFWKYGDCGDCCYRCVGYYFFGFVCSFGVGL